MKGVVEKESLRVCLKPRRLQRRQRNLSCRGGESTSFIKDLTNMASLFMAAEDCSHKPFLSVSAQKRNWENVVCFSVLSVVEKIE